MKVRFKKCVGKHGCGRMLPASAFSKNSVNSSGLHPYCKECDRERQRKWYLKNIDIAREQRKKWQENNMELHYKHCADYRERKRNIK